jgi:hypothetical protein
MPQERPQPPAANDNCVGDESFIVRNLVSVELNYTLAIFARDEGVP